MHEWDEANAAYVSVSRDYSEWSDDRMTRKKMAAAEKLINAGHSLRFELAALKKAVDAAREEVLGEAHAVPEHVARYIRSRVWVGGKLKGMGFEVEVTDIAENLNVIETRVLKSTDTFRYEEGKVIRWLLNVVEDYKDRPGAIYEEESSRNGTYGFGSAQRLMYLGEDYATFDIDD
jgi:hypothetical protein